MGLNTARLWPIRGGSINALQVSEVESRLCEVPPNLTRILVTHHPFDLPQEFGARYLVKNGKAALARLSVDSLGPGMPVTGAVGQRAERLA